MGNTKMPHSSEVLVDQAEECLVGGARVLRWDLLPSFSSRFRHRQGTCLRLSSGAEWRRIIWVGRRVQQSRITVANELVALHDLPPQINPPLPGRRRRSSRPFPRSFCAGPVPEDSASASSRAACTKIGIRFPLFACKGGLIFRLRVQKLIRVLESKLP